MNIWESLAADPQVEIGVLKHNGAYRDFIEQELPQVLAEMRDRLLTIKTLMEAQYLCADRLAHHLHLSEVGPVLKSIASGLSQYENADVFLWALGVEEEAYWKKRPGVSATEFSEIMAGSWSVGDLLSRHPSIILRPILFAPTRDQ